MDPESLEREENRRIRELRRTIDLVGVALCTEPLTVDDALDLVNFARRRTLELFPGTEDTFELIYAPRLARIIRERFGASGGSRYPSPADETG